MFLALIMAPGAVLSDFGSRNGAFQGLPRIGLELFSSRGPTFTVGSPFFGMTGKPDVAAQESGGAPWEFGLQGRLTAPLLLRAQTPIMGNRSFTESGTRSGSHLLVLPFGYLSGKSSRGYYGGNWYSGGKVLFLDFWIVRWIFRPEGFESSFCCEFPFRVFGRDGGRVRKGWILRLGRA